MPAQAMYFFNTYAEWTLVKVSGREGIIWCDHKFKPVRLCPRSQCLVTSCHHSHQWLLNSCLPNFTPKAWVNLCCLQALPNSVTGSFPQNWHYQEESPLWQIDKGSDSNLGLIVKMQIFNHLGMHPQWLARQPY